MTFGLVDALQSQFTGSTLLHYIDPDISQIASYITDTISFLGGFSIVKNAGKIERYEKEIEYYNKHKRAGLSPIKGDFTKSSKN